MKAMYRIALPVLLLVTLAAAAQSGTPAPDTGNQNRNEPSIHIQGQPPATTSPAPSNSPSSTTPAPTNSPSNSPQSTTDAGAETTPQPNENGPQTQILPGGDTPASAEPLLQPPELPKGAVTLVGGIAEKVDGIRNRLVLQPFGGGKRMNVRFDERTHFYRDGRETTILSIKKGDRVYADTMLVDGKIFARNLRVRTTAAPVEARGQITAFDAATGRITMRDQLTSQPVRFQLSPKTAITRRTAPANVSELRTGSVISVLFAGSTGDAQEVDILALPGANYMFEGRVTHLNLGAGTLAVDNASDNKNYEIHFNPRLLEQAGHIVVGSEISANTVFNGQTYTAQTITLEQPAAAQQ